MTEVTERARNSLVLALDDPDLPSMTGLLKRLSPYAATGKVGAVPFHANGTPTVVATVQKAGLIPWVDWKGHEINSIMVSALQVLIAQGVKIVTFHASSAPKALRMVADAVAATGEDVLTLGVTVLTTETDDDAMDTYGCTMQEAVVRFAMRAEDCGLGGIVCSPADLGWLASPNGLKWIEKKGGLPWFDTLEGAVWFEAFRRLAAKPKITPTIRPDWAVPNDQKRPTTPRQAILAGATKIVVGRPILNPPSGIGSSEHAAELILEEIEDAYRLLDATA